MNSTPLTGEGKRKCHFVLLGAGASRAVLPNGDKNGKRLPVMADLVSLLDLNRISGSERFFSPEDDFELQYSRLHQSGDEDLIEAVEVHTRSYFSSLQLPDEPTLYDHLVLSLGPEDCIATFNWDPLILQAVRRNYKGASVAPPELCFLHGCVDMGLCDRGHPAIRQPVCTRCSECKGPIRPSRLLFPIDQKNYNDDAFCRLAWADATDRLQNAKILSVWGYSAPKTDVEAMKLIKQSWWGQSARAMDEVEIIDIKSEDELYKTWSPLIVREHYATMKSLSGSYLWKHPRNSFLAFIQEKYLAEPEPDNLPPDGLSLPSLRDWYFDQG